MATEELSHVTKESDALWGINTVDNLITYVAGGFPLVLKGEVIGAIGVGGGSADQDCEIGRKVIDKFKELTAE